MLTAPQCLLGVSNRRTNLAAHPRLRTSTTSEIFDLQIVVDQHLRIIVCTPPALPPMSTASLTLAVTAPPSSGA
jgi:hypothetical protein